MRILRTMEWRQPQQQQCYELGYKDSYILHELGQLPFDIFIELS